MAKVKIRHAVASWQDEPNGHVHSAFRGQVVDMPDHEVARLKRHRAVIDPDLELDRPGVLLELPQSPSDEELINWVMNASSSEVQEIAHERPELTSRIHAAAQRVTDERRHMDDHLASVREALRGSGPSVQLEDDLIIGGASSGTDETPLRTPSDEIASVVQSSADDVARYVIENPQRANDILQAETEARKGRPRAAVIAAVQAAASG